MHFILHLIELKVDSLPFCNVHQVFMTDCEQSLSVTLLHLICDSAEETAHSCSTETKTQRYK